jgi:hypothetical protein
MRQFMMTVTALAAFGAMVVKAQAETPRPGTKEFLVRYIHSMERGQPNDDEMTPKLATINHSQFSWSGPLMRSVGPFKSITFRTVNAQGWEVYDAIFEKGRVEFSIAPLTSDGKVTGLRWQVLSDAFGPRPNNAGCETPRFHFNDDAVSQATMSVSRNAVCRLTVLISAHASSGDEGILSSTVTAKPKLGKVAKATARQFAYFPNKNVTGDDYFAIDFRYDRGGQQHRTTLQVTVHNNGTAFLPEYGARKGIVEALSAAPSTCTGMESVCRSQRQCDYSGGRTLARICGGKFCDWEFEQCMKTGWWQTGRGVSRQVERR